MHTTENKKKLIARVRRLKGQVEAIERALTEERECTEVVRTISAARGAILSLATEVLGEHLTEHVAEPTHPRSRRSAAKELAGLLKEFLR